MPVRRETDSLGEVRVPADRYWGAQTERCLENFRIGTESMPREIIRALGLIKGAAAQTNAELGLLHPTVAQLITRAADDVASGTLKEHFPLVVWQTGSGTQTNMNVNEVIANRAIELAGGQLGSKKPVHPNDHVNLGQSSNDVFPTAMNVSAVEQTRQHLLPSLEHLGETLARQAQRLEHVVKTGRTHLMDAVPVTIGQEFGSYSSQLSKDAQRIEQSLHELHELPLGGTAVGTGLNTHREFGERTVAKLAKLTGIPFVSASNRLAGIAAHDGVVALSGALKTLAVSLAKIANDIRLLASGPRCGLGELVLPVNEPGSSIMPGKVNPTQVEAVTMVAAQVMGNDVTIAVAGAGGQLELNAYKPVMAHALLQSIRLLGDVCRSFADRCIVGIEPDRERVRELLGRSLMLATALSPRLGYDGAAQIAEMAHREGLSLCQAAQRLQLMSQADCEALLQPGTMAGTETRKRTSYATEPAEPARGHVRGGG
jgi:fumarate hydratase class II